MSVSACDCNVEGTERPSCDPETGECLCRVGVSGIFCDECSPGYDLAFPACSKCHPCNALWAGDVTDVQRAASRMRTFIPEVNKWPGDSRLQHMLKMHAELDSLGNLTGLSPPTPEKLEKLCAKIRYGLTEVTAGRVTVNVHLNECVHRFITSPHGLSSSSSLP